MVTTSLLKNQSLTFNRQKVLRNYIVDFYCASAKLVIEIDGSQHYEDKGMKKDEFRTGVLEEYGLMVLRITNLQIRDNFRGVCEYIDMIVKERTK